MQLRAQDLWRSFGAHLETGHLEAMVKPGRHLLVEAGYADVALSCPRASIAQGPAAEPP